jgi:hypothetical protein
MAGTKQRRGKTANDNNNKATGAAAASPAVPAAAAKDGKITLDEQLDRALASIDQNQQTALTLHLQWRTHLLRMTYIVMIVSLHQLQMPSSACLNEIKVCTVLYTRTHAWILIRSLVYCIVTNGVVVLSNYSRVGMIRFGTKGRILLVLTLLSF